MKAIACRAPTIYIFIMNSPITLLSLLVIFTKDVDAQSQAHCNKYCKINCFEEYYYYRPSWPSWDSKEYYQCLAANNNCDCDKNSNGSEGFVIPFIIGIIVEVILFAVCMRYCRKKVQITSVPVQPTVTITSSSHHQSEIRPMDTHELLYNPGFLTSEDNLPEYELPPSYYEVVREN